MKRTLILSLLFLTAQTLQMASFRSWLPTFCHEINVRSFLNFNTDISHDDRCSVVRWRNLFQSILIFISFWIHHITTRYGNNFFFLSLLHSLLLTPRFCDYRHQTSINLPYIYNFYNLNHFQFFFRSGIPFFLIRFFWNWKNNSERMRKIKHVKSDQGKCTFQL